MYSEKPSWKGKQLGTEWETTASCDTGNPSTAYVAVVQKKGIYKVQIA